MAVSANRLELLQIADAVAREKAIDRSIVITTMEDAIQKAARSRYGSETEVRAEINPKTGEMRLSRLLLVVDQVENDATQIALEDAKKRNPAAQVGDYIAEASDRAKGSRSRARSPVPGIQGSHFRYRQRHRQTGRIRQRDRRSRPWRGNRAPRRIVAARNVPQRRSHPRFHLRCAPRTAWATDISVAYPPAIHGQAVRTGSAGNLRRNRRGQGGGARSRLAREDSSDFPGFVG